MSNLTKLPSPYANILFQARVNPFAVAVCYNAQDISYRAFCEHIEAMTRRLHAAGMEPRARVAINVQDGYLQWLVAIALGRLGMPTVSLMGRAGEIEFVGATVVVSDAHAAPQGGAQTITIDGDWTRNAPGLPPFRDTGHDEEAPCRIVLSSGTTGLPKKALFTYGHLYHRGRGTARQFGMNSTTKALTTMSMTTIGGFFMPLNVWANGGAVIVTQPPRGQWSQLVVHSRPNLLFTSTAQLDALVQGLPRDFWPMEHLVAYVAGSALPPGVNRRARLRLTQSLFVLYGSTEAGTTALAHASCADTRPDFTGYVLPTAQVEVVDDADRPVPNGTMGEIRIRAVGLVDEYLEDPAAQDGSFRHGWFYPGDAGILDDEGGLSVIGRTRELMNFGGVKVAPDSIENVLGRVAGVEDMAVFAIEHPGHGPKPIVAVVAGEGFDEARLLGRYQRTFDSLPPLSVVRVASIPRNEMGKVQRAQLAADVQRAQR